MFCWKKHSWIQFKPTTGTCNIYEIVHVRFDEFANVRAHTHNSLVLGKWWWLTSGYMFAITDRERVCSTAFKSMNSQSNLNDVFRFIVFYSFSARQCGSIPFWDPFFEGKRESCCKAKEFRVTWQLARVVSLLPSMFELAILIWQKMLVQTWLCVCQLFVFKTCFNQLCTGSYMKLTTGQDILVLEKTIEFKFHFY